MAQRVAKQTSPLPEDGAAALEENPPPEIFARRLELRRRLSVALLALLSVVLATICFAPFDRWYVAYVALVPWLLAVTGGVSRRWALLCGTLSGTLFWALNLYWLWWITLVGYFALVAYLSGYWLVTALVIRASSRRNLPMWLIVPIVWVALEYARAYVISGFPWLFLAHSQYARSRLIQICDVTGQYGVSFFVAMVNGAIVDLLTAPLFVRGRSGPRLGCQIVAGLAVASVALAALVGYGSYRLAQHSRRPGPVVGIVQQAWPISLNRPGEDPEKILQAHIRASERFIGAGCDLVVWPETMLPPGMNRDLLELDVEALDKADLRSLAGRLLGPEASLYGEQSLRGWVSDIIRGRISPRGRAIPGLRASAEKVGEISRRLGCPILAGGTTLHSNDEPIDQADRWVLRNSALWFEGSWRSTRLYSKAHLVPFSESVPFKRSWTGLYRILRKFVPPAMPQLESGEEYTLFDAGGDERRWRLAVPICYEGTFARLCRRMVVRDGRKVADVLVNLSNDGWFVCPWVEPPRGSTEHAQHLVQYCFRAVENRTPVIRAVNTGISASIDSDGRIVAQVSRYGKREMVSGTLLLDGARGADGQLLADHGPEVLVDDRISLYSLIGDRFAMAVALAAALLGGYLICSGRLEKRGKGSEL